MANIILIFLFSLIFFPYDSLADSVVLPIKNDSHVDKQENVSQQQESYLSESPFLDTEVFDRPDDHAPIGVIGGHVHKQGEFMVSLRTMMMRSKFEIKRIRDPNSYESEYVNIDTSMNKWTSMLGLMYGLTDSWTVMAMAPYLLYDVPDGDTNHDFGDVSFSALYVPLKLEFHRLVLSLEIFLPTGVNVIKGSTGIIHEGKELQYSLVGLEGYYAVSPKLSALFYIDNISLGFQFKGNYGYFREESSSHHRVRLLAHVWGAVNLHENFSASLRGTYTSHMEIETVNLFSYLGLNFIGTHFLKGHRLAVEFGLPVLDIIDLKRASYIAYLGWQKAF